MNTNAFRRLQSVCAWALFSILLGNGALGVSARQAGQKPEPPAATAEQAVPMTLELGKPVEREIKGGEKHVFTLNLQAGEFVEIQVEQKGIDVVVTLFDPDGKQLIEIDEPFGTQVPEQVGVVAESTSPYWLEVRVSDKEAKPGRYSTKITQQRIAAQKDRDRTAAHYEYADSIRLQKQDTKAGRETAIKKLESALELYRKAEDKQNVAIMLNDIGSIYKNLNDHKKALEYLLQALEMHRGTGNKREEAISLSNIGQVYLNLSEFQKALDHFTQAINLHRMIGNKKGEATALTYAGAAYAALGERRKAIDYHSQALTLYQEITDKRNWAGTLTTIGLTYANLGESRKAMDFLDRALPVQREIGDKGGEATTLNGLGLVYSNLGEPRKALDHFTQALPLYQAVNNRFGEAQVLANIGSVYSNLGEPRKALEAFTQALPIFREIENRQGEAYSLYNSGSTYQNLGESQKALDSVSQALTLFHAIGERRGESLSLNRLGSLYEDFSEYQKALDYYSQALLVRHAINDRRGEGVTLGSIGTVYRNLGDRRKALDFYERALPLHRAVGNRASEAVTLNNLANVYVDSNESQKAFEIYEQALALHRATGDRRGQAEVLTGIGSARQASGEIRKALDDFLSALPLIRAVGDRRGEALTFNRIGSAYRALGDDRKALESYEQALTLHRQTGNRSGEAQTLFNSAKIERDQGDLPAARLKVEDAVKLAEFIRSNVSSQELRASYFATVRSYYTLWLDILMRMHEKDPSAGHAAEAFKIAERGRARGLLELLAEARADIRQGVDPALLESEKSLQRRISAKADILIRLKAASGKEQQAEEMEKEITALTTELEQVRADIRVKSPRYAALTQPEPLGLAEIQAQVLDAETTLLEYALGEERSYLWVVTKTGMTVHALPKGKEIEDQARKVYELLARRTQSAFAKLDARVAAQAEAEYAEASAALSRMILAPVADKLDTKRLLVVADGALQYVPFAALPLPRTEKQDSSSTQNSSSSLVTEWKGSHWFYQ